MSQSSSSDQFSNCDLDSSFEVPLSYLNDENLVQNFAKNGIRIISEFSPQLNAVVISERGNGYFLVYEIHFGCFLLEIVVFNILQPVSQTYSYDHEQRLVGINQNKKFNFKRLCLPEGNIQDKEFRQQYQKKLMFALKQITIMKLLKGLQINSLDYHNPFKFDVVTYANAIQYCFPSGFETFNFFSFGQKQQQLLNFQKSIRNFFQKIHSINLFHLSLDKAKIYSSSEKCKSCGYFFVDFAHFSFTQDTEFIEQCKKYAQEWMKNIFQKAKANNEFTKINRFQQSVDYDLDKLESIYKMFYRGHSLKKFIKEDCSQLELQLFQNMNMHEVQRKLNPSHKRKKEFQYLYFYDYTNYKESHIQSEEWVCRVLNLLLRHEQFEELAKVFDEDIKNEPIFWKKEIHFQATRKLLLHLNQKYFDNILDKYFKTINAKTVQYLIKIVNLHANCLSKKVGNRMMKLLKNQFDLELQSFDLEKEKTANIFLQKVNDLCFEQRLALCDIAQKDDEIIDLFKDAMVDENSTYFKRNPKEKIILHYKYGIERKNKQKKQVLEFHKKQINKIRKNNNTKIVNIVNKVCLMRYVVYSEKKIKEKIDQSIQALLKVTPKSTNFSSFLRANYYQASLSFRGKKDKTIMINKIENAMKYAPNNCLHFQNILSYWVFFYVFIGEKQVSDDIYDLSLKILQRKKDARIMEEDQYKIAIFKLNYHLRKELDFQQIKEELLKYKNKTDKQTQHKFLLLLTYAGTSLSERRSHDKYKEKNFLNQYLWMLSFFEEVKCYSEKNYLLYKQHLEYNIVSQTLEKVKKKVKPKSAQIQVHFSMMDDEDEDDQLPCSFEEKQQKLEEAEEICKKFLSKGKEEKVQKMLRWNLLYLKILTEKKQMNKGYTHYEQLQKQIQSSKQSFKLSEKFMLAKFYLHFYFASSSKQGMDSFLQSMKELIQLHYQQKEIVSFEFFTCAWYFTSLMIFFPKKQAEIIKIVPKIIYSINLMKEKLYQLDFYQMISKKTIHIKKSESNLNTTVKQIEKLHKYSSGVKGVAYFYMNILMKLSSLSDYSSTILSASQILSKYIKKNKIQVGSLHELTSIYADFLEWKLGSLNSKNHFKIINSLNSLLYRITNFKDLNQKVEIVHMEKMIVGMRKGCERMMKETKNKIFYFAYQSIWSIVESARQFR